MLQELQVVFREIDCQVILSLLERKLALVEFLPDLGRKCFRLDHLLGKRQDLLKLRRSSTLFQQQRRQLMRLPAGDVQVLSISDNLHVPLQ